MIKFEDKIESIDRLIQKNRGKWHLSDIGGFGFDDVAQIIRLHIYEKWSLWDQTRPFDCWCNKIIINQIKNCVRNVYSKDAPPCSSCPFDRGNDLCGYTNSGTKCGECPAFQKWSKKKKNKFLLKTASSIDADSFKEAPDFSNPIDSIRLEQNIELFHKYIVQFLNPKIANIYNMIYVENLKDDQISIRLKEATGKGITRRQLIVIRKNLENLAKEKIKHFISEL